MRPRVSNNHLRNRMFTPFINRFIRLALVSLWPDFGFGNICDTAAINAAKQNSVPPNVMLALTRTETGRKVKGVFAPWPWTINDRGKGYWFASRDEMMAFAKNLRKAGVSSFDLGCFQLNYKWHSNGFTSIENMGDPISNADYAAKFLRQLYLEFNDWTVAAGAYHSRSPKFAQKYKARYLKMLARLLDAPIEPIKVVNNSYPLLRKTKDRRGAGSLVPLNSSSAKPLIIGLN